MIIFAILLTIILLAVIYFDITQFIIPNTISVLLVVLWCVYAIMVSVNWPLSLAVMGAVFAFGLLIFIGNIMGGGDVKLLTALSVWIGWQPYVLIQFFTWMALAGGILALFKLSVKFAAKKLGKHQYLPHFLKVENDIPYGLAIAYSFLYLLWNGQIISISTRFLPVL